MTQICDSHRPQIAKVQSWLSEEHLECAVWLVKDYYSGFRGRRFDTLAGRSPANEITEDDLNAVRALSIRFPQAFTRSLNSRDVQQQIGEKLAGIPSDAILEDLSSADFCEILGRDSTAWQAWEELASRLRDAGARAPLVGASKLLAAKRPQLIPLEDSYVRNVLGNRRRDIWQAIYCIVRDPQVRVGLTHVHQQVDAAQHITLHRVLDVIAWRKHQGHCCRTLPVCAAPRTGRQINARARLRGTRPGPARRTRRSP